MLDQDGKPWDNTRFQNALLMLEQFPLISRDADQDEDLATLVNDDQSAESNTTADNTHSMHPLVHFWARDWMDKADQELWFGITRIVLAKSIASQNNQEELTYRRSLLPHIDCFFNPRV